MTGRSRVLLAVGAAGAALAACAPVVSPAGLELAPAGFLLGVWHGFILMFSFLASLFIDSVGVYQGHNTGWPYDLGYLIGVMMFFSSGGAASKRR